MPRHTRNELKAGALILVAFVALCFAIVAISDFETWFRPTATYHFRFNRVEGLKVGDDVMYAGMRAGRVTNIEIMEQEDDNVAVGGTRAYVLITARMDKRFPLRANDQPAISKGFTGNVYLEVIPYKRRIPDTDQTANADLLKPGDTLQAKHVPGFGDLPAMAGEIKDMALSLKGKIDEVLDTTKVQIVRLADKADLTITDIRATVNENRKNILEITDNVRKVSKKADDVAGEVDPKQIRAIIDDVNKATEATRKKLDQLLPELDDIVENIKTASGSMKKASGNVETASEDVKKLSFEAKEMVVANRPHVDGMMEESHQAAARLNLGMEDIRRNPWKLLTRNIEADAYTQNIYDATMRYAEGARSLALASASLNALQSQPNASPEAVTRAKDKLKKLADNMPKLEAMLFDALAKRPK